ncbi:hypothetical protein IMSHALPRED_004251 [Imshaugia aleurites]|uniref:Uncharacterized protein n=1 Tax=Imshaugia aleurites TaxID=172621 RepID=A0A8H3IGX0_9LECA|nr:hypothetical protein IMSHALPRED_004251 [Imshaugia aleurites]
MASASGRTFKAWFKTTQAEFLVSIRDNQKNLNEQYLNWVRIATSVCIEVDHEFFYYQSSNRGNDMLFSTLKAIYTKNGAVDIFFECHRILEEEAFSTVGHGVDGLMVRDMPSNRKRTVAHIHVMNKGTMDHVTKDDVCNYLNDVNDNSEDDDTEGEDLLV